MAHTPEMAAYLLFMQWFQDEYPHLYIHGWKTIAVPTNADGVTMVKDGIDVETVKNIVQIIHEYYDKENSKISN